MVQKGPPWPAAATLLEGLPSKPAATLVAPPRRAAAIQMAAEKAGPLVPAAATESSGGQKRVERPALAAATEAGKAGPLVPAAATEAGSLETHPKRRKPVTGVW
ncbi:MAG: hypothetical protein ACK6EB_19010 [Planctomyces sp.]